MAVIGARSFKDKAVLFAILDSIQSLTAIVSGGAPGADHLVEVYAKTEAYKNLK